MGHKIKLLCVSVVVALVTSSSAALAGTGTNPKVRAVQVRWEPVVQRVFTWVEIQALRAIERMP